MKGQVTAALIPPLGALRSGTACVAPITVFWLFGVLGVLYGLLGGPTGLEGIDRYTVGLGVAMWAIAAVWTLSTLRGVAHERCRAPWPARRAESDETDPFEEIRKAH